MPSLSRHTFTVTIAGHPEPVTLTTVNRDQLAYEETRARRRWPGVTDGGVGIWWTFLAWRAAIRAGVVPADTKWETWADDLCLDVDEQGTENVDPTNPAQPGN